MQALAGLKIVITRPEAQARRWQAQLQSLGGETFLLPVMQIDPLANTEQQAVKQIASHLTDFDKIIFVSQNAVAHARKYFHALPPCLTAFAIGKTTAGAVRDWGVAVTAADEAMNSETLLALESLQAAKVRGENILICRGVGGRAALGDTLRQRGARVEYCELYHRRIHPQAQDHLAKLLSSSNGDEKQTLISVHSGESAEMLAQVLEQEALRPTEDKAKAIKQWPILVPGSRVEDIVRQLGFGRIICAVNASDEIMTQTLVQWWNEVVHDREP